MTFNAHNNKNNNNYQCNCSNNSNESEMSVTCVYIDGARDVASVTAAAIVAFDFASLFAANLEEIVERCARCNGMWIMWQMHRGTRIRAYSIGKRGSCQCFEGRGETCCIFSSMYFFIFICLYRMCVSVYNIRNTNTDR